jgi:hypothetical protein
MFAALSAGRSFFVVLSAVSPELLYPSRPVSACRMSIPFGSGPLSPGRSWEQRRCTYQNLLDTGVVWCSVSSH